MWRHFFIIFLLFLLPATSFARHYSFNQNCKQAYSSILKLRFSEAQELLIEERSLNSNNLVPEYLDNYIDFLTLVIGEDEDTFKKLKPNKSLRINRLKKGDPSSPYYRYLLAETYLQWAFARLKFEEYLSAAWEIRQAYILLEENQQKFPDFPLNKPSLGLLHALVGTIPDNWKWVAKIAGMKGTIKQGMEELKTALEEESEISLLFRQQNLMLYTFMMLHLDKREEDAWKLIYSEQIQLGDNLLNHFVAANVAIRTGHNGRAIEILEQRPGGGEYFPFLYLDYMLGMAKLNRLDGDANKHFRHYVKEFKGRNYIKNSYQKLGWHALILGDPTSYEGYMQKCSSLGSKVIDADKQAMQEAESGRKPNVVLLKARLLFDGGYYARAISGLIGRSSKSFAEFSDQLEFTYRAGRIYHNWGKIQKAIPFYQATVRSGSRSKHYFAANAALQLGFIYENQGNQTEARKYFNKCLEIKGHAYKNSLDQKAKSGLGRLKKI